MTVLRMFGPKAAERASFKQRKAADEPTVDCRAQRKITCALKS